jgi:outer membrane murein-binding lipoprotein Lpp
MSKISEFADALKAQNTRLQASLDGVTSDVADLKAKIDELQNSQGQISPEDQALLDELQTSATALADKLAALDSETPPPAPAP